MIQSPRRSSSRLVRFWTTAILPAIDEVLELVHAFIDLPLQKIFHYFCDQSPCWTIRRRWLHDFLKVSTTNLVNSYFITFTLYFCGFFLAQTFTETLQRTYFLQPFVSSDQRCVAIPFIRMEAVPTRFHRLHQNFLRESSMISSRTVEERDEDQMALNVLLDHLRDSYFFLCQRSLYLYARFQTYSSLLHSNFTYYRFDLPQFSSPFPLNRPPFLDLCLHADNRSHLNELVARLKPLASLHYPSVNLFLFHSNSTQITITLYQLETNSTHLERQSLHTGWLYDLYKQFHSFKYERALSTVLFDGLALQEDSVEYFDRYSLPLPADPLLALNEMIEQDLIILPLC